jgi:hypothetical protein
MYLAELARAQEGDKGQARLMLVILCAAGAVVVSATLLFRHLRKKQGRPQERTPHKRKKEGKKNQTP